MSVDEPWVSSKEKEKQDFQKRRDIPEDVAEQARQTWNKIRNNSCWDGSILISQAILAERERCAKIAEVAGLSEIKPFIACDPYHIVRVISKAIRGTSAS